MTMLKIREGPGPLGFPLATPMRGSFPAIVFCATWNEF